MIISQPPYLKLATCVLGNKMRCDRPVSFSTCDFSPRQATMLDYYQSEIDGNRSRCEIANVICKKYSHNSASILFHYLMCCTKAFLKLLLLWLHSWNSFWPVFFSGIETFTFASITKNLWTSLQANGAVLTTSSWLDVLGTWYSVLHALMNYALWSVKQN